MLDSGVGVLETGVCQGREPLGVIGKRLIDILRPSSGWGDMSTGLVIIVPWGKNLLTLIGVLTLGYKKMSLSKGSPVSVHVFAPKADFLVTMTNFDWIQKPSVAWKGDLASREKHGTFIKYSFGPIVVFVLKACIFSAYSPATSTQKLCLTVKFG